MSDSGEADLTYLFNAVKEIITTAKRADFKSIVLTTKAQFLLVLEEKSKK